MTAYQLTVPVDNKPGRLAQVSGILNREKINIRAITISSFGDKGFFNILVDDPTLARKALEKAGIAWSPGTKTAKGQAATDQEDVDERDRKEMEERP